ncbi:hypothetical protein ACLB2K_045692 [Fragaria x ananassa]
MPKGYEAKSKVAISRPNRPKQPRHIALPVVVDLCIDSVTPLPKKLKEIWFLPEFEPVSSSFPLDFGIRRLDHVVGNVPDLAAATLEYVKGFTGFHEFTRSSQWRTSGLARAAGLNSVVLASNDEMVLLSMNEPVYGTKRKSQIQTYLEHNEGAGVQHLALVNEDIFRTLKEMRQRSGIGGFDFMSSPPPAYYRNLKKRAGDVLSDEQIKECEEKKIFTDRRPYLDLLQDLVNHLPSTLTGEPHRQTTDAGPSTNNCEVSHQSRNPPISDLSAFYAKSNDAATTTCYRGCTQELLLDSSLRTKSTSTKQ